MKGITCCGDCGYYNWKKHKCTRAVDKGDAKDSFYADCPLPDVLPKTEARLLMVDVSDASWHDGVLWFEHRDYKTIKPCLFVNCRDMVLFGRLERVMCFDVVGRSRSVYMLKDYGVKYRCWTSRPTDAQREATPWD